MSEITYDRQDVYSHDYEKEPEGEPSDWKEKLIKFIFGKLIKKLEFEEVPFTDYEKKFKDLLKNIAWTAFIVLGLFWLFDTLYFRIPGLGTWLLIVIFTEFTIVIFMFIVERNIGKCVRLWPRVETAFRYPPGMVEVYDKDGYPRSKMNPAGITLYRVFGICHFYRIKHDFSKVKAVIKLEETDDEKKAEYLEKAAEILDKQKKEIDTRPREEDDAKLTARLKGKLTARLKDTKKKRALAKASKVITKEIEEIKQKSGEEKELEPVDVASLLVDEEEETKIRAKASKILHRDFREIFLFHIKMDREEFVQMWSGQHKKVIGFHEYLVYCPTEWLASIMLASGQVFGGGFNYLVEDTSCIELTLMSEAFKPIILGNIPRFIMTGCPYFQVNRTEVEIDYNDDLVMLFDAFTHFYQMAINRADMMKYDLAKLESQDDTDVEKDAQEELEENLSLMEAKAKVGYNRKVRDFEESQNAKAEAKKIEKKSASVGVYVAVGVIIFLAIFIYLGTR